MMKNITVLLSNTSTCLMYVDIPSAEKNRCEVIDNRNSSNLKGSNDFLVKAVFKKIIPEGWMQSDAGAVQEPIFLGLPL